MNFYLSRCLTLREKLIDERIEMDFQAEAVFYWISSLKKKTTTTTRRDGDSSDDDNLGDEVDRWMGRKKKWNENEEAKWMDGTRRMPVA